MLIISLSPNVNLDMMHHKDRILPYIFSAFSIFMGAQLIAKLPLPKVFSLFMLGSCLILIVLFAITTKWKISGHGAGVGSLLGALLALTFRYGLDLKWPVIAAILITGLVGSSRIYLKKHTPAQIYAGVATSVLCMYLTIYFF
jgi:membrane-associated phospholipid phosphatase